MQIYPKDANLETKGKQKLQSLYKDQHNMLRKNGLNVIIQNYLTI